MDLIPFAIPHFGRMTKIARILAIRNPDPEQVRDLLRGSDVRIMVDSPTGDTYVFAADYATHQDLAVSRGLDVGYASRTTWLVLTRRKTIYSDTIGALTAGRGTDRATAAAFVQAKSKYPTFARAVGALFDKWTSGLSEMITFKEWSWPWHSVKLTPDEEAQKRKDAEQLWVILNTTDWVGDVNPKRGQSARNTIALVAIKRHVLA